ncbi:hypothetical protein [Streptomyces guryensis]|uniref:Uncharacterized protein n=1 Tax=Streptomyces guryensis TaxID=2886947 RepID=A0A9Q3Z963_9ACTN|nr:hypothetical protein [Streptomyces guryensis]MCD9877994.1 hypothetical protein [Streptomyces guryensis]
MIISEQDPLSQQALDVMEALGADDAAEPRVVRETAAFLLDHQPVIDLPPLIDLDDVVAACDGYLEELRRRLAH